MVRTQIQLPNELYEQARSLAAEKEISLAEVVRRGLEQLFQIHPPGRHARAWKLEPPANTQLRTDPFAKPDWRIEANLGPGAARTVAGRRGKKGKSERGR